MAALATKIEESEIIKAMARNMSKSCHQLSAWLMAAGGSLK
jgi:hypothetical protein